MRLIFIGFVLVFIGIITIMAGVFHEAYQSQKEGESPDIRGGGIIMIGPIPIIFGSDTPSLKVVIILAIVLIVISFIISFLRF